MFAGSRSRTVLVVARGLHCSSPTTNAPLQDPSSGQLTQIASAYRFDVSAASISRCEHAGEKRAVPSHELRGEIESRIGSRPTSDRPLDTQVNTTPSRNCVMTWVRKISASAMAQSVASLLATTSCVKKTAIPQNRSALTSLTRRESQPQFDPDRLVFINETWGSTNMARIHRRCPRGRRLRTSVPSQGTARAQNHRGCCRPSLSPALQPGPQPD